jgi:tetratricopeptide (TPR) repeat protein
VLLVCSLGAFADDDQAEEIERSIGTGEASYLKGDYDAAREAYQSAWQLAQQTAPADPIRYDVLKRLTAVQTAAGQYPEAESYLQQALTRRENQFGSTDPKAIEDFLEVATLCRRMKDFDRALVVLDRVWSLHVRTAGMESLPVADDMSRKAAILLDQEKPEQAAAVLTSALELRSKLSGADNPALLPDLDRLGGIDIKLRQYDKAGETYRRALVIRERLYGREHADLIATLDGLAYAYYGQKKYDLAEPLYLRLLTVWTGSAGQDHPMVATVLDKLAGLYAEQQKWDQATDAVRRSNVVRAHFLAVGLAQEAGVRLSQGEMDAAKTLYERALALMDPPDPIFDELRAMAEKNLKLLEPPKPQPKKSTPKKK